MPPFPAGSLPQRRFLPKRILLRLYLSSQASIPTQLGSVTVLFNWLGGLQTQFIDPTREQWEYVRPIPGHALLILGDTLVEYSNGILKSGFHRVVKAPREQKKVTRINIVSCLKSCVESVMADLMGKECGKG